MFHSFFFQCSNINKRPNSLALCLKVKAECWIKHTLHYSQSVIDFVANITSLLLCNLWVLQELVWAAARWSATWKLCFSHRRGDTICPKALWWWAIQQGHFYQTFGNNCCAFCFLFSWEVHLWSHWLTAQNSIQVQLPSTFCRHWGLWHKYTNDELSLPIDR